MTLTPEQRKAWEELVDWMHQWKLDPDNEIWCPPPQNSPKFQPEDRETILALAAHVRELVARLTAPIVCICGSTRFKQAWIAENARLTGEGYIVLAVGLWGHHERVFPDDATKKRLDELHLRKIDLCDWVWVLDVGGYIGESTRNEIAYAEAHGKFVRYLSKEFPDYVEPVDPILAAKEKAEGALMGTRELVEWGIRELEAYGHITAANTIRMGHKGTRSLRSHYRCEYDPPQGKGGVMKPIPKPRPPGPRCPLCGYRMEWSPTLKTYMCFAPGYVCPGTGKGGVMNVIKFAAIMQEKLDKNDHKDHWSGMSLQYLFTRLSQETKELSRANKKKLSPDEVDREAADVANFAMMIADNYRENWEG